MKVMKNFVGMEMQKHYGINTNNIGCKKKLTMQDTVYFASLICDARLSTFLRVLQKMTAWVTLTVEYKSHSVSNFQSCNISNSQILIIIELHSVEA